MANIDRLQLVVMGPAAPATPAQLVLRLVDGIRGGSGIELAIIDRLQLVKKELPRPCAMTRPNYNCNLETHTLCVEERRHFLSGMEKST